MSSSHLLTTPFQILVALGDDYSFIKEAFDHHQRDRNRRSVGLKAYGQWRVCALCGEAPPDGRLPEWAHLIGLSECGETEPQNLIPLCNRPNGLGCHQLYDRAPTASVSEMRDVQQRWLRRTFSPEFRPVMIQRANDYFSKIGRPAQDPRNRLTLYVANSHFALARDLCHRRIQLARTVRERLWWQAALVGVWRRTGRAGDLELASNAWRELRELTLPPELFSRLRYEGGYIEMLNGHHAAAHELFRRNVEEIDLNTETAGQWSGSVGLVVQTMIAEHGPAAPWDQIAELAARAREACASADEYVAREWVENWNWHMVRICLVKGDYPECVRTWQEAEDHALTLIPRVKWDPLGIGVKRTISGMVLTEIATNATGAERRFPFGVLSATSVGQWC